MLKRFIDIIVSINLIILLGLPMLGIALCVALCMGRPILFKQIRIGYHCKPFTIYKFRTMVKTSKHIHLTTVGANTHYTAQGITRLGNFLRRYSLDELPQLLNVLKGDLSLVGPRPVMFEALPTLTARQNKRHIVRPGLTGLAQINGRNKLSWRKKFAYDIAYIQSQSIGLDIKILLITIVRVLTAKDVQFSKEIIAPTLQGEQDG